MITDNDKDITTPPASSQGPGPVPRQEHRYFPNYSGERDTCHYVKEQPEFPRERYLSPGPLEEESLEFQERAAMEAAAERLRESTNKLIEGETEREPIIKKLKERYLNLEIEREDWLELERSRAADAWARDKACRPIIELLDHELNRIMELIDLFQKPLPSIIDAIIKKVEAKGQSKDDLIKELTATARAKLQAETDRLAEGKEAGEALTLLKKRAQELVGKCQSGIKAAQTGDIGPGSMFDIGPFKEALDYLAAESKAIGMPRSNLLAAMALPQLEMLANEVERIIAKVMALEPAEAQEAPPLKESPAEAAPLPVADYKPSEARMYFAEEEGPLYTELARLEDALTAGAGAVTSVYMQPISDMRGALTQKPQLTAATKTATLINDCTTITIPRYDTQKGIERAVLIDIHKLIQTFICAIKEGAGRAKYVTWSFEAYAVRNGKTTPSQKKKLRQRLIKEVFPAMTNFSYDRTTKRGKGKNAEEDHEHYVLAGDCLLAGRGKKALIKIQPGAEFEARVLKGKVISAWSMRQLGIESDDEHAYIIADAMREHYRMDANIINGTACRLSVSTLLRETAFKTYAQVKKSKQRSWQAQIKTFFEHALDRLRDKYGFLISWRYTLPGGGELPGGYLDKISYEQWAKLIVEYHITEARSEADIKRVWDNHKRRNDRNEVAAAKKAIKDAETIKKATLLPLTPPASSPKAKNQEPPAEAQQNQDDKA